uniref:HEAT repeat-containing protein n=1 Tax=Neospora caninum (strain Liverpool) TaxID=572307 RepID=A0A0F7UI78_NEOCL|nr:TPA: HEAT repeat-containing protein [Neospora caninum Liverpool]
MKDERLPSGTGSVVPVNAMPHTSFAELRQGSVDVSASSSLDCGHGRSPTATGCSFASGDDEIPISGGVLPSPSAHSLLATLRARCALLTSGSDTEPGNGANGDTSSCRTLARLWGSFVEDTKSLESQGIVLRQLANFLFQQAKLAHEAGDRKPVGGAATLQVPEARSSARSSVSSQSASPSGATAGPSLLSSSSTASPMAAGSPSGSEANGVTVSFRNSARGDSIAEFCGPLAEACTDVLLQLRSRGNLSAIGGLQQIERCFAALLKLDGGSVVPARLQCCADSPDAAATPQPAELSKGCRPTQAQDRQEEEETGETAPCLRPSPKSAQATDDRRRARVGDGHTRAEKEPISWRNESAVEVLSRCLRFWARERRACLCELEADDDMEGHDVADSPDVVERPASDLGAQPVLQRMYVAALRVSATLESPTLMGLHGDLWKHRGDSGTGAALGEAAVAFVLLLRGLERATTGDPAPHREASQTPSGQRRTHFVAILQALSALCTSCWPHLVDDAALQKALHEALQPACETGRHRKRRPAPEPGRASGSEWRTSADATAGQLSGGQDLKTNSVTEGRHACCDSSPTSCRYTENDASVVEVLRTAMDPRFLVCFLQQQKELEVLTAVASIKVRLAAFEGLHREGSILSGACGMVRQLLSPPGSALSDTARRDVSRTDEQGRGAGRTARTAGHVATRGGLALLRSLLHLVANSGNARGETEERPFTAADARNLAEHAKSQRDAHAGTTAKAGVFSEVLGHLAAYSQTHDVHAKRDALLLLKQLVDVAPASWLLHSSVGSSSEADVFQDKSAPSSGAASAASAVSPSRSDTPSSSCLPSDHRPCGAGAHSSLLSRSPSPIDTLIEVALSHWQHPQRSVSQVARSLWEALSQVTLNPSPGKRGTPVCVSLSQGQRGDSGVCCLPHRLALAVLDLSAVHRKAQNLALLSLLPAVGVEWLLDQRPGLVVQLLMEIGDSFHTGASAVKFLEGIMKHLCQQSAATGKRRAPGGGDPGQRTRSGEAADPRESSNAAPATGSGKPGAGESLQSRPGDTSGKAVQCSGDTATGESGEAGQRPALPGGLPRTQGRRQGRKASSGGTPATGGRNGAVPVPAALRQVLYPLLVDALFSLPFGSTETLSRRTEVRDDRAPSSAAWPLRASSLNSLSMVSASLSVPASASDRRLSPEASQKVAATVFPLLQALDPQGLAAILQLLYLAGCRFGPGASETLRPTDVQGVASSFGTELSDDLELLPSTDAPDAQKPEGQERSERSRRMRLQASADQLPWSIGEAVLLQVARQAGMAEWSEPAPRLQRGVHHEASGIRGLRGGSDEAQGAAAFVPDTGRTGNARKVGTQEPTAPQAASCSLVVSGVDLEGNVVSVRICRERLQHGLQSGDDEVRMALLKVVALSRLSSVPPARIELELLLDVLEHGSGRQASGATKAAFAEAFKRFLQRARDAYRKQLIERTPQDLRLLLQAPACAREASGNRPAQATAGGVSLQGSARSLDPHASRDRHPEGDRTRGGSATVSESPEEVGSAHLRRQQEDDSLRAFLVFLQRLHRSALLQCLPCMHPDRQNTGTTLLLFLYTLWGSQPPSDLRKGSSCANAALAAARGGQGRLDSGQKLGAAGPELAASETFAGGCAVAEALGFYAAPVQAQLLGMLASRWPRQSEAARKILKLFPRSQLEWGVPSLVPSPRKLPGGETRDSAVRRHSAELEQKQPQLNRASTEDGSDRGANLDGHASRHATSVPCLRSCFVDVLVLIHSIRESDYSAGASQLELALFSAFVVPLRHIVAARTPSLGTAPRSSGATERDWKRPRQSEQLAYSSEDVGCPQPAERRGCMSREDQNEASLSADVLISVLSHALIQQNGGGTAPSPLEGVEAHQLDFGGPQQRDLIDSRESLVQKLFRLLHVFLAASQQRLDALEHHARLSADTPDACIHGLLVVLTKLFRELPPLQSLIQASADYPKDLRLGHGPTNTSGFPHGNDGLSSGSSSGSLAAEDSAGESGSARLTDARVWGAWRMVVTRLLRLLMDACSSMFCVIAEGTDSVMLNAVWQQSGQQEPHQKRPSEKQTFNVDCRGHPLLVRRPAEDGGHMEMPDGEAEDEEETAETLLAVRGWVTVKAAASCLSALLDWVPFEAAEEPPGDELRSDRGQHTETEDATAANSQKAAQTELCPDGLHPGKTAVVSRGTSQAAQRGALQTSRTANAIVTVAEMNAIGRRLLHFLLCCRHLGAMNSLFDSLAGLSRRLLCSAHKDMQALPRTWVHSLLLLLLPPSLAGPQNEAFKSASPAGTSAEIRGGSTDLVASVPIASEGDVCAASLPPPLRKSASLGLAFVAVLAGEAASADSTLRGGDRCPLLQHAMSILLPLAEGRFDSFFPSIEEAYAHRAHCLNVVRAVIRSGALSCSIACVSLLPPEEAIAALEANQRTEIPPFDRNQLAAGGASTDSGDAAADEARGRHVDEKEMANRNAGIKGNGTLVGNGAPLPALALAAAVRSSNSTSYFPLRNAATLLLVASVKRLAGKDNDSLHVPTFPLYSFCSGAQQRSSLNPSLAEAQIDLPFLQSAGVLPILLRTLQGAVNPRHPWTYFVDVEGEHCRAQGEGSARTKGSGSNSPLASAAPSTATRGAIQGPGEQTTGEEVNGKTPGQKRIQTSDRDLDEAHESRAQEGDEDQGALVAVLLLVSRLDFASAVSEGPRLASLLSSEAPCTSVDDSNETDGPVYGRGAQASSSAGLPSSPMWLLRLLTALRTHLTGAHFHTRLLAARALANYAMQEARLQGPQALLLGLQAAALSAAHSHATSNTTCGLLLLSLELLQRPEVAAWLEQTARNPVGVHAAVHRHENEAGREALAAAASGGGVSRKVGDDAPRAARSIDASAFASDFLRCMQRICSHAPAPLNRLLGLQAVQALAIHLATVAEASSEAAGGSGASRRRACDGSTGSDGLEAEAAGSLSGYGAVRGCTDAPTRMGDALEAAGSVVACACRYLPPCFARAYSRCGVPSFNGVSLERLLMGRGSITEIRLEKTQPSCDGSRHCLLCRLGGVDASRARAASSNSLRAGASWRTALAVPLQTVAVCGLVDAAMLTPGPAAAGVRLAAGAVLLHLVQGLELHAQVIEQALRCCRKRLKKGRMCASPLAVGAKGAFACAASDLRLGLQLLWQAVGGAFCTTGRRAQSDREPCGDLEGAFGSSSGSDANSGVKQDSAQASTRDPEDPTCMFSRSRIQSGFSSALRAEALRLLALLAQMLIAANKHENVKEANHVGQCVSEGGPLAGLWPLPEDVAKEAVKLVRTYPHSAPVRKGFLLFGAAVLSSNSRRRAEDARGSDRSGVQTRQEFRELTNAWTACLVACSCPEAEVTLRRAAVQALGIVGLPVPAWQATSEASFPDCCLSDGRAPLSQSERSSHQQSHGGVGASDPSGATRFEEALQIWDAMMTLLQDGEPVVRAEAIEACTEACSSLADSLVARARAGENAGRSGSGLGDLRAHLVVSALRSAVCSQMPPRGVDSSVLLQLLLDVMVKLFPLNVVANKLWRSICEAAPSIREFCADQLSIHLSARGSTCAARGLQQGQQDRRARARPLFDEEPANLYTEEVLIGQSAARNLLMLFADRALSSPCNPLSTSCCSPSGGDSDVAVAVALSASRAAEGKGSVPFLLECRASSNSTPGSVNQKADAYAMRQQPPEAEKQAYSVTEYQTVMGFAFLANEVTKVAGEVEDVCICLDEVTVQRLVWGDACFALGAGSSANPECSMRERQTGDERSNGLLRMREYQVNQEAQLPHSFRHQADCAADNAAGGRRCAQAVVDASGESDPVCLGNPHCTQQTLFQPVYGALLKASLLLILLPAAVAVSPEALGNASVEGGPGGMGEAKARCTTSQGPSDSAGAPAPNQPCLRTKLEVLCRWIRRLDAKLKTTETGSPAHWVLVALSHRLLALVDAVQSALAKGSAAKCVGNPQSSRDGLATGGRNVSAPQCSQRESPVGHETGERYVEAPELPGTGVRDALTLDRGGTRVNAKRPNAIEAASSLVETLLFLLPGLKRDGAELRCGAV